MIYAAPLPEPPRRVPLPGFVGCYVHVRGGRCTALEVFYAPGESRIFDAGIIADWRAAVAVCTTLPARLIPIFDAFTQFAAEYGQRKEIQT